jgi:oligopeptide transport system substrate-binding protein
MVDLADGVPATSMVPVGVPGRDEDDHVPAYDPDAARDLLAAAGYRGGAGFPPVTLATYGVGFEQTVADQLELNLGVSVQVEAREFQDYLEQVSTSTQPQMWTLAWIADYPHAHDFLGLLLESGSGSNVGGWSNADYDALIEQAAATADPDEQATFYARAQEILEQQAPVVPVAYGESWALSRDGLLGALESGVGLIRYAGLDWAPGAGR